MQAAFREMHRSGFRSADLDTILGAAVVTKGAMYYHFDNKDALGHAVVEEVIANNLYQKWVQPLRNAKDPIEVLVRIIQSESVTGEEFRLGCPLHNLSNEMSGDEGFRKRAGRVFRDWHDAISVALSQGQKRGIVRSDINPNETATFLIAAYQGYLFLARIWRDARMLQSVQRRAYRHLESLRRAPGRTRAASRR